jgi:hypothetical protein
MNVRRLWLCVMALAGWGNSLASTNLDNEISSAPGAAELHARVEAVRAQLRADGIDTGDDHVGDPHKLAQWFNFPNFPNFPNWRNWGNWPNFPNWPNWRR